MKLSLCFVCFVCLFAFFFCFMFWLFVCLLVCLLFLIIITIIPWIVTIKIILVHDFDIYIECVNQGYIFSTCLRSQQQILSTVLCASMHRIMQCTKGSKAWQHNSLVFTCWGVKHSTRLWQWHALHIVGWFLFVCFFFHNKIAHGLGSCHQPWFLCSRAHNKRELRPTGWTWKRSSNSNNSNISLLLAQQAKCLNEMIYTFMVKETKQVPDLPAICTSISVRGHFWQNLLKTALLYQKKSTFWWLLFNTLWHYQTIYLVYFFTVRDL